MRCIKTGFDGLIESHDLLIHGDAFILADYDASFNWPDTPVPSPQHWLLLRVCWKDGATSLKKANIRIERPDHWFNERQTGIGGFNSTLIAAPGQWSWLGYEGQEI